MPPDYEQERDEDRDDEGTEEPWSVCPDCGSRDGVCFDGSLCDFLADDEVELGGES